MRVSLAVLPPPRVRAEPRMPRGKLRRVTARVMKARSLKRAVVILEDEASRTGGNWGRVMARLARGLEEVRAGPNVFATPHNVFSLKGNTKLPFAAFSTLPEHTCPGAGECLDWCYSFTSWRYPEPWARQVMNTLLLRFRPDVVAHHFSLLGHGLILRLYVDGDFDSARTVEFWFGLLKGRPDIRAYGYSKSWDLLWEWGRTNEYPANYRLNLSSGGKAQGVTADQMMSLPITRGHFTTVPVSYRPAGKRGKVGFERYDDPEYHRAVRDGARAFSCPGKCGECAGGAHACGSDRFRGVVIVNGAH